MHITIMEGTANSEMINEMITELNTPTKDKNSHLIVGEDYKITGGKYKKWKTCRLEKINDTYSDVSVQVKQNNIVGEPITTETCKVKNIYLLRANPPAVDMPDAEDLLVVENLEEHFANHPQAQFAPGTGEGKSAHIEIIEQECEEEKEVLIQKPDKEVKEISWLSEEIADNPSLREYLKSNEINRLVEENERLKAVIQNLAIKLS